MCVVNTPVGDTQVRHITLAGDDLTLTSPPDSQAITSAPLAARRENVGFRES